MLLDNISSKAIFCFLYSRDTVVALFDELVINAKKFATATSKEIEKWR
jgi:hypothetical protein